MIHAYGSPDPPVPRLVEALAARGHEVRAGGKGGASGDATLLLGPGLGLDPMAAGVLFGAWRAAPGARVLVVSLLGVHPDARARRLRELWQLEESARGSGMPVLVMRLGPLVGPASPLWRHLRSRPRLPQGGNWLLNPTVEDDVVETLERALKGGVAWEGWYEVAGGEVWTLGELAAHAARLGPRLSRRSGDWEPPLDELREHRLAETSAWRRHFAIEPTSVREAAAAWVD